MLAAGCTAEQIVAVVRADEDANAEKNARKREQNRIRQQKQRARNAASRVTECDKKEIPPTPPKEKTNPPSPPKGGHSPHEFSEFWAIYPNKVGKRDAEKSFAKAQTRASLEAIMAGLRAYVAKTDDRPWCNPATWLNQDRWEDAPASVQPRQGQPPPREDGFARALREDLERERMKRHEPPDHETTGYLDASVTGTDQSGAGIVELFAAQGVRR